MEAELQESLKEAEAEGEGTVGVSQGGGSLVPGLPVLVPGEPLAEDDESVEDSPIPEDLEALVQAEVLREEPIRPGTRCTGIVDAVSDSGVIVSYGDKVEGMVPLEEFRAPDGSLGVTQGQEIDVILERRGAHGSFAVLSYRRARQALAWKEIESAHRGGTPLQGTVVGRVKGGLRVDIRGLEAFLPGSQVDLKPVRNLDAWVGREVEVLVVEFNRRRSNVVVSRRRLLQAERLRLQKETLSRLEVGGTATGVVKNITTYGVFIDLGGIDGLVKLTELSYGRIANPAEVFQPGQELSAKVLRIDPAKERVALSLRALRPDPWLTVEERYAPGSQVRGRVSSVVDYGAFVELEPGVEGLIHISEIVWSRHLKHPSKTFSPGDETEARVLKVNAKDRRISLSFKQLTPDPWDAFGGTLQVGQVVAGVVRRIKEYGLFVEIVEGIEGLVHISDLSWDTRTRDPRAFARRGQEIDTVILHVDTENRRLSLGIKQLEPDAWDAFFTEHAVGDTVRGLVVRIVSFGAYVELAPGVEGLCRRPHYSRGKWALQRGSSYMFSILDLNERGRRVGLRCSDMVPIEDSES